MSSAELTIEQYSEKAIVVRGNTQPYKESLKELGGKWNSALKGGGGWIFPNSKKSTIEELNKKIETGSVKGVPVEKKTYEKSSTSEKIDEKKFVPLKDYLDLLARVERLEQITSHVDFVKGTSKPTSKPESNETEIVIESDEEEEPKVERLLKKKNKQ